MGKIEDLYKKKEDIARKYSLVVKELKDECSKLQIEKYQGKYIKFPYDYYDDVYMYVTKTSNHDQPSVDCFNDHYIAFNWIGGYFFHTQPDGISPEKLVFDYMEISVSKLIEEEKIKILTKEEFFEEFNKQIGKIKNLLL